MEQQHFVERRKRLFGQMKKNSIALLPTSPMQILKWDTEYEYRPHSDFYYLTGFSEPEAVAVLIKTEHEERYVLFNRASDLQQEIWNGYRAGQEGAVKNFGADESYPTDEIWGYVLKNLESIERVYFSFGINKAFDERCIELLDIQRKKWRAGFNVPFEIIDLQSLLHEMRLFKSPEEIALMRRASAISSEAHIRAMKACRPDAYEYELEAELLYTFCKNGGRHQAYPAIVASGPNACILHYIENNRQIKDGDLVLIDAGCEYDNYSSDITRTFPANGKFSAEQKAIYEIVLNAQLHLIEKMKPGANMNQLQTETIRVLTQGLMDVGILKGNLDALIEKKAYFDFYMHRQGHWLGLDTHDVGSTKINGEWREFKPNMVVTAEPGIYIRQMPNVDSKWWNIGVRIEDDILITEKGNEVLSPNLAKTVKDIEALMA